MYSYPNFEAKIIEQFKNIVDDCNFSIVSLSEKGFSELELRNPSCIIRFTYDRGELGCTFKNPNVSGNEVFPAYSVWRHLWSNDNVEYAPKDWDFEVQLKSYYRLISERLRNVLNGDFSWVNAYRNNNQAISKKIEFMMNNLGRNHPITKKFWSGDPSWEDDFDQLL